MPSDSPYARFGIPEVVNGVGHATRLGGSSPHPDVLEAMAGAGAAFVEMDDLHAAASRVITRCTGAEAGLATCSASAALSLAAAACLAGNDPELMDRLPDVSHCPRSEIIYPELGAYDYDHAIRLSGARLIPVDYDAPDGLERIARAIGPRTAAVGFVWRWKTGTRDFAPVVDLAHRHHLPVIVDAAVALPPASNLRAFITQGADLVAYSGGKHLGGPQASGILCGTAPLIRSAWVQMVDMDVRPGTWSLQHWVEGGWMTRPPRHGIGRSMKVGKEAIIGLLTALERYDQRDHAAEEADWQRAAEELGTALAELAALRARTLPPGTGGLPYPRVLIESGPPPQGLSVAKLIHELRRLPRKIILSEDETSPDRAYLFPHCLAPGEASYVVSSFRTIASAYGQQPTP